MMSSFQCATDFLLGELWFEPYLVLFGLDRTAC